MYQSSHATDQRRLRYRDYPKETILASRLADFKAFDWLSKLKFKVKKKAIRTLAQTSKTLHSQIAATTSHTNPSAAETSALRC